DLSWTASTDNIGVTGYYIFRRANALWTMLGQSTNRAYVDTTVMPSTAYSFAVKAYDAGGNISGTSTVLSLNTPAAQIVSVTNPTTTTVTTKNTIEEPLTQTFKPYIVLNGDAVVHVPYGGTYSEAGAKGYLVLDGTAVAPKRLLGGLDATKPGSYTVTYQLLDSSGGVIASITRTVIVDPPLTVSSVELITTQTQYANYCDDPKHETECQSYASQKVISSTVTSHGTGITEEQFSSVSPTEVFQAATLAVPITDAKQLNAVCAQAEYVGACTNSLVAQGVLSKKEAESQVKQVLKKSEEVTKIFTERIGARSFEDTDQDGITNYDEVNIYRTDPKKADTNKDGVSDGEQLLLGEDPLAKKQTPPGATSTVPVIIIPEKKVAYEDPRFAGNTKKEIFVAPTIKTTPVLLPAGAATTTPTTKTTLEGRALPNSFVTIYIFSEPIVVTIKTDSAGAWTYTLDKELPDGTHEMYSAITDSGGRILAKSSPLPFVKEAAAAVSLGSTVLVPPINETPPGFFSGTSLYVLIVIIIGILGLAVAIMGYVANRNKGGSDVPPATLPPPTQ
ncbi:MAG: DUF5011 domain-containing protein, partial [bacterium]|nr:DUF5011 domain-containing protein [bacterium]